MVEKQSEVDKITRVVSQLESENKELKNDGG